MNYQNLTRRISILLAAMWVTGSLADNSMTNKDLAKLIKAGMGDAVVLQAIDNSTGKFDTSADALIALKKGGASDAVIQRVLAKRSPTSTAELPGKVNETQRINGQCVDEAPDGYAAIIDEGRQVNVRPAKVDKQAEASTLNVLGGWVSLGFASTNVKAKVLLKGARSPNRLNGTQPIFTSIGIPSDQSPEEEISIVKLESSEGSRSIEVGEVSTGIRGAKSVAGYPPGLAIPIDLVLLQKACTYTAQGGQTFSINMFSARPKSPLLPGEYALMISGGGMVIDVGLDGR